MIRIKPEKLGARVTSKRLGGVIKLNESHAQMFYREGRFDLLDGVEEDGGLKSVEDMSKKELINIAQDMPGFKKGMNKTELIELIKG